MIKNNDNKNTKQDLKNAEQNNTKKKNRRKK